MHFSGQLFNPTVFVFATKWLSFAQPTGRSAVVRKLKSFPQLPLHSNNPGQKNQR